MRNLNNYNPDQQGNPNQGDPSQQEQGPSQRDQPDELTPYPYPPLSYRPPPELERGYHQYPPPQYPPPPNMATIHAHQGQDRLHPPPGTYRPDPYAQSQEPQGPYETAAPRQRTAIACRHCRRRKIRCSGFETSADGRCSNCVRSNQDCMFTPGSSQTQAFVPAHAAYPHLRNGRNGPTESGPGVPGGRGEPPVLYGTHGQPLPPPQDIYYQNGRPPMNGDPPLLVSAIPESRHHRGSNLGFAYPEPTNLAPIKPAGATPGHQTRTAPTRYNYPPQPAHDRRTSPQSSYSYDACHLSSPHGSPFQPMQPHQASLTPHPVPPPPQSSATSQPGGATPPPTSTTGGSQRGGLNVRDMLNPGDYRADQHQ